jgi:hypothetical protein
MVGPVFLTPFLALIAKMVAAASLVVTASVVAERSGAFLAAMVATLPISAGPALIFLALEHDDAYIATAALGGMATNILNGAFCVIYAMLAQRHGTALSLGAALLAWFVMAAPLTGWDFSFGMLSLATIAAFAILIPFIWRYTRVPMPAPGARSPYAIPLRALGVALLIGVIALVGNIIGPTYAGMLTVFPIVLSTLIVILQPRVGGPGAAAVIANTMPGLVGLGVALAVVHLASMPLGRFAALALGLLTCFAWNGGLILLRMSVNRARR